MLPPENKKQTTREATERPFTGCLVHQIGAVAEKRLRKIHSSPSRVVIRSQYRDRCGFRQLLLHWNRQRRSTARSAATTAAAKGRQKDDVGEANFEYENGAWRQRQQLTPRPSRKGKSLSSRLAVNGTAVSDAVAAGTAALRHWWRRGNRAKLR